MIRGAKKDIEIARKVVGGALFGPGGYANPKHDKMPFTQTQERLVADVARAIAQVRRGRLTAGEHS